MINVLTLIALIKIQYDVIVILKMYFLTLLHHIPGHIVHLFDNVCQKITKI